MTKEITLEQNKVVTLQVKKYFEFFFIYLIIFSYGIQLVNF